MNANSYLEKLSLKIFEEEDEIATPLDLSRLNSRKRVTWRGSKTPLHLMLALRDDRRGVAGDAKGRGTRVWSP